MRVAAERIYDVAGARARFARGLKLSMNGEANAVKLKQLLGPYRNGPCPVAIDYRNGDAVVEMWLGDEWRVTPDEKLESWVREKMGARYDSSKFPLAAQLFEQMMVSEKLCDFLTLEAYRYL